MEGRRCAAPFSSALAVKENHAVTTLDDLLLALQFVSSAAPTEHEAYLCKDTGEIHYHSEYGDNEEDLPDDIDSERYIAIPHKMELNLGKHLVLEFATEFLPDEQIKVRQIFSRPGAYARFKDLLERAGMLQQWYDYEAKAEREALLTWCGENGIEIDGQPGVPRDAASPHP